MATLTIHQGRTLSFTATITGLASLSGYTAKCYFRKSDGTALHTATGTPAGLVVTFTVTAANTQAFPVGDHDFEIILFNGTNEYSPAEGTIKVKPTLQTDPS
jgi:hypothetical protein